MWRRRVAVLAAGCTARGGGAARAPGRFAGATADPREPQAAAIDQRAISRAALRCEDATGTAAPERVVGGASGSS